MKQKHEKTLNFPEELCDSLKLIQPIMQNLASDFKETDRFHSFLIRKFTKIFKMGFTIELKELLFQNEDRVIKELCHRAQNSTINVLWNFCQKIAEWESRSEVVAYPDFYKDIATRTD